MAHVLTKLILILNKVMSEIHGLNLVPEKVKSKILSLLFNTEKLELSGFNFDQQ